MRSIMKIEFKVPSMGESISEATVVSIIRPSGSQVGVEDEILELETDKVNQMVYAPQKGIIHFNIQLHDKVTIGQVLGYIDTEATAKSVELSFPPQQFLPSLQDVVENPKESLKSTRYQKEDFIKELKEEGQKRSLSSLSEQESLAWSFHPQESHGNRDFTQKSSASQVAQIESTAAMLTIFNEVDLSQIIHLRDRYQKAFKEKYEKELSLISFFVKACVAALPQFPSIHSYLKEEQSAQDSSYEMGIAVETAQGIVVPVLCHGDKLSYAEIERTIEKLTHQAYEGSLSVGDLHTGSFAITDAGLYDSMLSTPFLTGNQRAILALHNIIKRPVVVDDQITIRPIMHLALSYDHRFVRNKEAAFFLAYLRNILECPAVMLLGL
ncbi:Dihydrolipoyllysine-residue succinyltransferase component of 2-oxoglutarate dehydrogenase complex|nr:Dihydrolipoyllysine-residue succinyltransferase component of 2-oxoglutarate dehydrogenase complex [Neochlamydia sp. AcF84]